MNYLLVTLVIGFIATMIMDVWGYARKPLLGIPAADYRLVGRWVSHLARGRFQHESIAKSPAVSGELLTGWVAHYLLGLVFAAVFVGVAGESWLEHPTMWQALGFGLATVLVPTLVMQPAMGMKIALRTQSVMTHGVFGSGLLAGAWVARATLPPDLFMP